MHDGRPAYLPSHEEEELASPDAVSQALGGAPWLRMNVRRAATCWLEIGPWGARDMMTHRLRGLGMNDVTAQGRRKTGARLGTYGETRGG